MKNMKKVVINSEFTKEGCEWLFWAITIKDMKNPDVAYFLSVLRRNNGLLVALAEKWLKAPEKFPVRLFKYTPKVVEYNSNLSYHISGDMGEEEVTFDFF